MAVESCNATDYYALPAPSSTVSEAVRVHLLSNLLVMTGLAIVDKCVLTPLVRARVDKKRSQDSARWFFLHSLANFCVVLGCVPALIAVLTDPVRSLDATLHSADGGRDAFFSPGSRWPLTIINSAHVYHMLGGFSLSPGDYFHHLLFIPTLGFAGQAYSWGALGNWLAFFISGLPGGIDYLALGLNKLGIVSGMTEKRLNANLNTWCRMPGILLGVPLLYQGWLIGHAQAPGWAVFLQLVLPPYNALYYGKQASANWAVHYMLSLLGQDELIKSRIAQRTSVTTGEQVMAWKDAGGAPMEWKDALGVPQRGS